MGRKQKGGLYCFLASPFYSPRSVFLEAGDETSWVLCSTQLCSKHCRFRLGNIRTMSQYPCSLGSRSHSWIVQFQVSCKHSEKMLWYSLFLVEFLVANTMDKNATECILNACWMQETKNPWNLYSIIELKNKQKMHKELQRKLRYQNRVCVFVCLLNKEVQKCWRIRTKIRL